MVQNDTTETVSDAVKSVQLCTITSDSERECENLPTPKAQLSPSSLDSTSPLGESSANIPAVTSLPGMAETPNLVNPPNPELDEEEEEEEDTPLKTVTPSDGNNNTASDNNPLLRNTPSPTNDSIRHSNASQYGDALYSLIYDVNPLLSPPDHDYLAAIRNSILPEDLVKPGAKLDKFQVPDVLNK